MRKPLFIILALALVLPTGLLSGCASKYGTQKTHVNYYPACYRPIHDLRASEHKVAEGTAGGAFIGAMGGALLGFLTTGKAEGALVGGVAGAATGAVVGNIYAKKKQISDENRRMASYLEDIDGDIRSLDIVSASARTTLDCYDREFKVLLNDIRTRRISRREAEERYGEITSGREEAIALLGNAVNNGRDLDRQYEQAFVEEERSVKRGSKGLTQAKRRKQNLTSRVNEVSRQKQQAENQSVSNQRDFSARLQEIDA